MNIRIPTLMPLALCTLLLALTVIPSAYATDDLNAVVEQYGPTTTYTITRKGKRIGTHEITFQKNNSRLLVTVKSRIRVTVLKIPVFVFDYDATEVWENNKLISVSSDVRENDQRSKVRMQSTDDNTALVTLNGAQTVERLFFTSNHWNPAVTKANRVFNTLNGSASEVSVDLINEDAAVKGVSAVHYRYTGDIQADTWYNASGKWLKLQFKGEDGSQIEYTIDD